MSGHVVLLAGPGDTTHVVANYLADRVGSLTVVVEASPSRRALVRRRAARLGWVATAGQVAFAAGVLPLLRRRGRRRIDAVLAGAGLDATPYRPAVHVPSVNGPATVDLLARERPDVVVVNGTRIIAGRVLAGLTVPVINTHAGMTPRYRGVHGGYWALAEGRPELVGTTIHLVDEGIDTGGVLGRATFTPGPEDTIATYPYLHLAAGLPVLAAEVEAVLAGRTPTPLADDLPDGGSRLYHHPTVWGYAWRRITSGVR